MDITKKMELIKNDTEEIISEQELEELLDKKESPVSYVGIAPTGPPHIGYYRSIAKQMDLIKAGCKHKILIADLHAYLDDMKCPWDKTEIRSEIYQKCLELLGLKGNNVEYIKGSSFQKSEEYYMKLLKSSAMITVNRGTRAASEVCRMDNAKISTLMYPLMQSLDCWALDIDIAYGGIDQRHVYALTREIASNLGFRKPICIFTPLGISLNGNLKMSASDKSGRLELFASPKDIKAKITKAYCPAKEINDNPIIEYNKYFVFPRIDKILIERPEKYGGDIQYKNFDVLKEDFASGQLHPQDLKAATADYMIRILKPIREYFEKNDDLLVAAFDQE